MTFRTHAWFLPKPILSIGKHSVVSVSVAEFPCVKLGLPMETLLISKSKLREKHLQHLDQRDSLMLFPENPSGSRVLHLSGKELWHRCLLQRPRCNSVHPKQLGPFPERLKLQCSSEEILSDFKDICLLGHRPVHRVGEDRPSRYLGTTYGRCSKSHRRFSRSIRKEA